MKKSSFGKDRVVWNVFAVLFSLVNAIGFAYERYSDKNGFIILTISAFFVLIVCFEAGSRMLREIRKRITGITVHDKDRKILLIYFICLVSVLLVFLVLCYPGLITYDTQTQIKQSLGSVPLSNKHPVFLTAVLGLFIRIGLLSGNANFGLFVFLCIQILFTAVAEIYSLWIAWRLTDNELIVRILFVFYLLNPIIIVYSSTAGKDSSFAVCLLFYSCSLADILMIHKTFSVRLFVQALISSFLMCLVRHNGIYAVVISLLILTVFKRELAKHFAIMLLSLVVLMCTWSYILFDIVGVSKPNDAEKYSILFQSTARTLIDHGDELTEAEIEVIDYVLTDADKVKELYNSQISDPIKALYNPEVEASVKRSYFRQWFRLLFRYPDSYAKAIFNQTYGYFYLYYSRNVKPHYFLKFTKRILTQQGDLGLYPAFPGNLNRLDMILSTLERIPGVNLIMSMASYSWVMFYVMLSMIRNKKLDGILVIMPLLLVFLTILASPVNGYLRYMYPIIICIPFFFCLNYYFDSSRSVNDIEKSF